MPCTAIRVDARHENPGVEVKIRRTDAGACIATVTADVVFEGFHQPETNGLVTPSPIRKNGRKNANLLDAFAASDKMAENLTQKPTDSPLFRQSA